MSEDWSIQASDTIMRTELHARYGGRRQGGIGPSRSTPNVFIFTDPQVGHRHGYYDGWGDDQRFHYTGEGQRGDQQLKQGNRAILEHVGDGRHLRLFEGSGGRVTYLGEFAVDPVEPYYWTDAPETAEGPLRQVIVFRLTPQGSAIHREQDELPARLHATQEVSEVPVEQHNAERSILRPNAEEREIERRESRLVHEYKNFMENKGSRIVRFKILPAGERRPIFADLFDSTRRNLLEAKGSVSRESIRMAVGQILDYFRFIRPKPRGRAILLPHHPRSDLSDFLGSVEISSVWPDDGTGFTDDGKGQFS